MTKEIPLTRGKVALVDDDDYAELSKYKWEFDGRYATSRRIERGKKIYMHRYILQPTKKEIVDHANGNKLDNRRDNLRIASFQQNSANSKLHSHNTSGYRGVYKWKGYWRAAVTYRNKQISCGYYKNKEDAALAYNKKALELFGEFAKLNEVSQELEEIV